MIVERMASDLGLTVAFVTTFARGASHAYKSYSIAKHGGGHRIIDHPSKQLKAMQRWLLSNVIEELPIHPAAVAYRRHKSIFDNANVHAASRFLLRMDFQNFFPSIKESDLVLYIAGRPTFFGHWTPLDVETFCKLVCRKGHLTIGAPTSPGLSNALCYEMDSMLSDLCAKQGATYTRYADDLFFSTTRPNILRPHEAAVSALIKELRMPKHLVLNLAKTRHSSKRGARKVTGIVLGSDGQAHIGRALKREIRALIHRIDSLDESSRSRLTGLLSYSVGFDPDFMNGLITKYGHVVMRKARNQS
jgi:RNA-directed DNA polymerase